MCDGRTWAERLAARVEGCWAFNFTRVEKLHMVRKNKNQYGDSILFDDQSRAFIPAGTAQVQVRV